MSDPVSRLQFASQEIEQQRGGESVYRVFHVAHHFLSNIDFTSGRFRYLSLQ